MTATTNILGNPKKVVVEKLQHESPSDRKLFLFAAKYSSNGAITNPTVNWQQIVAR